MNSTRHFENENLKDRNIYLFRLLIAVAGLIGFQFLYPILKPSRTTLISGTKVIAYNYAEISFKGRKNHWEFQKESNTVPRNL
jgi:hypothetical protein